MAKQERNHPYIDSLAFTRLMLLIATFLKYPGIGSRDFSKCSPNKQHNAIDAVRVYLQKLATELNIKLPLGYPSIPTLRKDLETLRRYGILGDRMYRWGYYLGTGALSTTELKIAFNALASQAEYQGDAQVRRVYEAVSKRLRGLDMEMKGEFFYPTRQYLNRAIIYTDPEEMAYKGENRDTLFHQLSLIETAIIQGQAVEIYRSKDLYGSNRIGYFRVFPLQLIYHDVAWYLLYEACASDHLVIGRLNRFSDYCELLKIPARGLEKQKESLTKAETLLEHGWGLSLGELEDQKLELGGNLPFITVKVRFFPPVSAFILEGELRHLKQVITPGLVDRKTGDYSYIDYQVSLPPRSLNEFSLWVNRFLDKAQVLSPPQLVEKHRLSAQALVSRYGNI